MPSALETLVKILKLEKEQGYKNAAVIGGLAAYEINWTKNAHAQARRPEHHALVDELSDLLKRYDGLEVRDERHESITYMLDRIMGRKPTPANYLEKHQGEAATAETVEARPPRRERERPPRREQPEANGEEQPQLEGEAAPVREAQAAAPPQPKRERPPKKQNQPQQQKPRREQRQGHSDDDDDGGGRESGGGGGRDDDFSRLDMDFIGGARVPAKLDIPVTPRLARPPRQPRQPVEPERAAEVMRGLSAPVERVRNVGTKLSKLFNQLGVYTINDLLFYLPRRYDDYTKMLPIRRLQPNQLVTVIGTVRHAEVRIGRTSRRDFFMVIDDGTAQLNVTFFGQHYLQRQIKPGMQIVLQGQTSLWQNRIQMSNPEWEPLDPEEIRSAAIVPVYKLTEGINGRTLRKLMGPAIDYWADNMPDYMPENVLERTDLAELGWAIKNLHFPESHDHLEHARRRYIFDQLIMMQLTILANRREWQSAPSIPLDVSEEWLSGLLGTLFPYPLTGAQQRAINDIRVDVGKSIPMNRLLQGDVGSGKTAVALTALMMAVANGKQAALMAPTSILAEQHYRNISQAVANLPEPQPRVALLTGSISTAERDAALAGIADGSISLIIGTHALIQEGVEYRDLALAIIDEQHRFGVEQRRALRGKGTNPHLLVMTATPIPRTLALTMYADLDLSVIDEMPPGRIPVKTRVIEPVHRERAYHFIEGQLEQGRQAFIVYPLVEASESIDAGAAVEAFEDLKRVFFHHKVGLLHGKMKAEDKDRIMAEFREHQFDVMVTTSVAEVGVDIPNASVILIEGANRFGLAQLHQFRGRVGRGGFESFCLLLCDTTLQDARDRLHALELTNDGFKLAEIDMQLRGAGDLINTRQSGKSMLQLVEDMRPELVELAQREARTLFEDDPTLEKDEHRLLAERIRMLQDERSDIS
ncbi:MAG: ATP-dependent DNA helicase RecG [Chloroflexi bacterium]|uniref:ATP-dependent DNA helicase RecG n=1 Tax=Candidatus Flexifilum breve TaxID=3140694 RepID=UPI00313677DC|nr:ATP-dependent DNA helicase RecG [Chloroflexota bacterium]